MTWRIELPQANEASKCIWDIVPYTRGRGLDIGCGPFKPFQHFIGVDSGKDIKLFGTAMDPDIVCDATEMPLFTDESMDFVFSSHTLEHIKEHEKALKEWWRIIKQDGYLVLYLPHRDFYPCMGQKGANPDHVHDFLPSDIIEIMRRLGWWDLVVKEERDDKDEYSMFLVFKKLNKDHLESWKDPKPEKTCAIYRYGAVGDMIQMTSILPGLKSQGYHITLYTSPQGYEVVKHEPLIDKVILQDHDQVPNVLLGNYWAHLKSKYDKSVNLCESVEAQFLALPDRVIYNWPKEARHSVMNNNYCETLHLIAGVPYTKPESRFIATEEEFKWVDNQVIEIGANPIIMWVLAGSSVHKVYPHIDSVIENIFKVYSGAKIVTVGDERCRDVLEVPWKDNQRIVCRSGMWNIRETIAFAQRCDLIIGPETGVLNSVAMNDVKKIVMLSHSSIENLTRDWVNTITLHSTITPCYPCHKMIHTWDQCVKDETGTAKCMADISPARVFNTVVDSLRSESHPMTRLGWNVDA